MLAGELYNAGDPELVAERRRCSLLCERFNSTSATDREGGRAALRELLGAFGDASTVMPPFRCDYGYNITLGDRSFLNYGSIVLDVAPVAIGHDVQIATNVQILTATHPLDPAERRSGLELGQPVRIEDGAWLGGGAIVLPGITIGRDAVVGAGSVVTRNVEARTVVAGNPARVIRRL
jgi:maltose O-acetyltransferase